MECDPLDEIGVMGIEKFMVFAENLSRHEGVNELFANLGTYNVLVGYVG
jgi:hypothetical protein